MSNTVLERDGTDLVATSHDMYASRNGQKAHLIPRKDPIVYTSDNQPAPIDLAQIKRYQEQGFLILEDVFSPAEVQMYQQELTRLRMNPKSQSSDEVITEGKTNEVRSIFRVHENSTLFRSLATDKRLVELARYILGDDVYIHQSRLNYKPGFRGKEFYWHSDFETWHVEDGMPRMRALSMSISLTENTHTNGPLMLIPRSHNDFAVCEGKTPEGHYLGSLKQQEFGVPSDACLQAFVNRGGITPAICRPGSVILFDCNLMHGSNGNITPSPRSNAFFVYNAVSNKVQAAFCDREP